MNHDAAHLNSATTELVALSSTERIRAIETDRWVQYPRARQALAILSYVLRHPRSTRMPSIAIYGDSGMGKTMIMEKFRLDHPADFDLRWRRAHRGPASANLQGRKPVWSKN